MSPKDFAAAMQRKKAAITKETIAAEKQTVNETQDLFRQMSSGTIKTKQLRMMGHPYARRDPQIPVDPSIINLQSGIFEKSWQKSLPKFVGTILKSSVVNIDPKAVFMLGTHPMIERPIDVVVALKMQPRRLALLRNALQRGLNA